MQIKKIRYQVLEDSKPIIKKYGWNENLFKRISKVLRYNYEYIQALFPNGYVDLLQLYLDDINLTMTKESKKIDLLRLKIHERIRELIILRLNIMTRDKSG